MENKGEDSWLDRRKPNALNFYRLLFASLVIVAHAWNLRLAEDPLHRLPQKTDDFGTVAVNGFFIISGFLIVGSWLNRKTADQFLQARILRIWPAFAVALIVSIGFGMLGAGGVPQAWEYLKSTIRPPGRIVESFLTLQAGFLNSPLTFSTNPLPGAVNGSLWTISYEFACYLAVAFLGVLGIVNRRRWMLVISAAWLVCYWTLIASGKQVEGLWARFATQFAMGALFALFSDRIPASRLLAVICGGGLLAAMFMPRGLQIATPLLAPYLIFYTAFHAPVWLRSIGSKSDISYGVYLYAFPVQQLLYFWWPNMPPMVNIVLTLGAAFVGGYLSFRLVEHPTMKLKSVLSPTKNS